MLFQRKSFEDFLWCQGRGSHRIIIRLCYYHQNVTLCFSPGTQFSLHVGYAVQSRDFPQSQFTSIQSLPGRGVSRWWQISHRKYRVWIPQLLASLVWDLCEEGLRPTLKKIDHFEITEQQCVMFIHIQKIYFINASSYRFKLLLYR